LKRNSGDGNTETMPKVVRLPLNRIHVPGNLLQSPLWALAKRSSRITPLAFRVGSFPPILVLIHRVSPDATYAYLPWGPQLPEEEQNGRSLEVIARSLQKHLPEDCVFMRFDLPWESPWSDREEGRPSETTRELEMNFATREHNLRKAPTDVQPTDTLVVDLDRDDDELLGGMKPRARHNIRLADRRGVRVRIAAPRELRRWYQLYGATMRRHGKRVHGYHHFRRLMDAAGEVPAAGALPGDPRRTHNIRLILAERAGDPLAGMVLAVSDDYAMYLYGASSGRDRRAMPTYLLQWEAMRAARRLGARRYDLFGIPADRSEGHPMHGLLRFKEGFGGTRVARRGCWDFPYDGDRYYAIAGREAADRGYHG
jgi:lipid II:glycine glycyltransferase (peptidoglycan interpeptide bridge formation enzyme)